MEDKTALTLLMGIIGLCALVILSGFISAGVNGGSIQADCTDMNGHKINPEPDLCNWSCNGRMESQHMQAHLDETCRCCKARGIDYSGAKEYQPRVYVVNPDGSQGEDRTCAYYPDAKGCP